MESDAPIRLTTANFPRTKERQEKARVPIGIVFNPIPQQHQVYRCDVKACQQCGFYPVPSEDGSQTCSKCKFCGANIEVPSTAIPTDLEFELPLKDPPRTVFIIDASGPAKSSNFLQNVLSSVAETLKEIKNCAFLTISNELCFLMSNGRIGVIPDLEEAKLPDNAFLVEMPSSLEAFTKIKQKERGPDIFPVISMLSNQIGNDGHIYLFLASVPSGEVQFSRITPDNESAALRGPNYNERIDALTKSLVAKRITFDIFIQSTGSRLLDCATFGRISSMTGGRIVYANSTQLWNVRAAMSEFLRGIDTVCNLQISQGAVTPSLGAFAHNPRIFKVSAPRSIYFPVKLPDIITDTVVIQAVVTFRAYDGTMRRRVYTRYVNPTDDISLVYSSADCGAVLKYVTSSMISLFLMKDKPMNKMDRVALALLKPIYECYRFHVSRNPNRLRKLVMPRSLETLPKFTLGILKSTAFCTGISLDERGYQLFAIDAMSPVDLQVCADARLLDVTDFVDYGGEIFDLGQTERNLEKDRIYLLYDGLTTFIWVGRYINQELCKRVFAKASPYILEKIELSDTEESKRLFSMVKGNMRHVVQEKGTCLQFTDRLVEDTTSSRQSLVAWLASLLEVSTPVNK